MLQGDHDWKFLGGLDWASDSHAVCVVDARGRRLLEIRVEHSAEGLSKLNQRLTKLADPSQIPIAIERPNGLVVDALVEAGHPVVPIHPNVLKATRARHGACTGKSDPGDAFILAELLRTDLHRFRFLEPQSDDLRALKAMVRSRDDLVAQRKALSNQLRALLESFWPGAAKLFSSLTCAISLAFLEGYPSPAAAKGRLGPGRMAQFLRRHRYPGRRTPEELLARLKDAPKGLCGKLEEAAKAKLVRAWVDILKMLIAQERKITSEIEQLVAELPQGRVLMSFPRAGKLNAAQILAEIGTDPARFSNARQLASEAGTTPVTYTSGRHRGVVFRTACNKRLRNAVTTFANNSRHESPWAYKIYAEARGRGCRHNHAVRILARAWIGVIWKAWSEGQLYDPSKHRGAVQLKPAAEAKKKALAA